eukprot:3428583-Prymnesium_polylepis.1
MIRTRSPTAAPRCSRAGGSLCAPACTSYERGSRRRCGCSARCASRARAGAPQGATRTHATRWG